MSVRFDVDLEELDDVIGRLTGFQRQFERRLEELDRTVADLHLTWTGQAAAAQRKAHEEWARGARQMHAGLVRMTAAARLAHDRYRAAAAANESMWGGLG